MENSTIISLLSLFISAIALVVSGASLWFTWLRRGRLLMTKPTIIFLGYDDETPKLILRTLLYSTSARGQIIENMYVKLSREGSEQVFSFWGYGATRDLAKGSGLYVGKEGIACNHHFVLSKRYGDYEFAAGPYLIAVFAVVAGQTTPIKLAEVALDVLKSEEVALRGRLGVLYELGTEDQGYFGHAQEYVYTPSEREN